VRASNTIFAFRFLSFWLKERKENIICSSSAQIELFFTEDDVCFDNPASKEKEKRISSSFLRFKHY